MEVMLSEYQEIRKFRGVMDISGPLAQLPHRMLDSTTSAAWASGQKRAVIKSTVFPSAADGETEGFVAVVFWVHIVVTNVDIFNCCRRTSAK